jgi:hypothetical protein
MLQLWWLWLLCFMCPTREPRPNLYCKEHPPKEEAESQSSGPNAATETEVAEETLEFSDLPLCVIRKILTGKRLEEDEGDDWLRTNIFHT